MNRLTAIVTGANRGIGLEITKELALMGFTVVMACRDVEKARAARREIDPEGKASIEILPVDMASLKSIGNFTEDFRKQFGRVNVLINNAGIFPKRRGETADGFEAGIGVNYFGAFYLTRLLLPFFPPGADNRIVNTTSGVYTIGRFRIDRINGYRWLKAYAVSKYALILFTKELAERIRDFGITANVYHPGIVRTTIMTMQRWYDFIIQLILKPLFISTAEGARTGVYLAADEGVRGTTGLYFTRGRAARIPRRFLDAGLQKTLWEESEKILGLGPLRT